MNISENSMDFSSGFGLTKETNQNLDPVYLPISAVAEVIYCPRNFYYRIIEGANEENHHMVEGRLQEERRNQREHIKREGSLLMCSVAVSSEILRLTGLVDALEIRGDTYP
jgi:CRISPR-associated protein Cas1